MTRLMGALLLTAAGALAGLGAVGRLRERAEGREELAALLERMEFELGRFSAPLPELFGRLAGQFPGPAGALCRRVSEGLLSLGDRSMEEIWGQALETLPATERRLLLPLGQVLGRYGAEEQRMALAACREAMERAAAEARDALRERGRMTVGVSAAAAGLLAVLLI